MRIAAFNSSSTPRWLNGAVLFSGLWALAACGPSQAQGGPPMAPPVSVAAAVQKDVQAFEEYTGRLEATQLVDIRARVAGTLERVHFREGQDVKRGELLFSVDARPYAAELARVQAQLASARSAAALSGTELARAQKLLEQKAVSQQEFDQAGAAARNAQASVGAAEAAVASARLNVEYAQIRAPISGRASRSNVSVGNLVAVGDPVLTTLVSQDKVYAYFDISEQTYLAQARGGKPGALQVLMGLSNESGFPHNGVVDFIDNRLNTTTGSIRARAVFDNAQRQFTPGLFARVRLATGLRAGAVLTPERAIGTDQSKRFVYVVGADKKAQFREVKLGPLLDGMRVVESGLKAGELVVVNGLQRVQPGAPLAPEVLKTDERGMPIDAAAAARPGAPAASAPPPDAPAASSPKKG